MDAVADELDLEVLLEQLLFLALVVEGGYFDLVGVVADVDLAKSILRVIRALELDILKLR